MNLYKATVRVKNDIKTIGWEVPLIRMGNTVAWLLENAKEQGLSPRKDGLVRVQDLLAHPEIGNLEFGLLERMIRSFRSHSIKLVYEPHPDASFNSQINSWWIGLKKTSRNEYRVSRLDKIPIALYKTDLNSWSAIKAQGIQRGKKESIILSLNNIIPSNYSGTDTYVNVDFPHSAQRLPFYKSVITTPRKCLGNPIIQNIKTSASSIPPSLFESATHINVERIPLIKRITVPVTSMEKGKSGSEYKMIISKVGVEALKKLGYEKMVDRSLWKLGSVLEEVKSENNGLQKSKESSSSSPSSMSSASPSKTIITSNTSFIKTTAPQTKIQT